METHRILQRIYELLVLRMNYSLGTRRHFIIIISSRGPRTLRNKDRGTFRSFYGVVPGDNIETRRAERGKRGYIAGGRYSL